MERRLQVLNRSKGTSLGTRIALADDWWGRMRGYLGRGRPGPGEGILLSPCNRVHTFGMAFELDVIFLGASGDVLDVVEGLPPWRTSPRVDGCRYVLEVQSGAARATCTSVGDRLSWAVPPPFPKQQLEIFDEG